LELLKKLKEEIYNQMDFIEEYGRNQNGDSIFKERLYLYQGCGGFSYNGFNIFSTNWSSSKLIIKLLLFNISVIDMEIVRDLIIKHLKIKCNGAMITCYYPSTTSAINKALKDKVN
jgi:hypothetical protein